MVIMIDDDYKYDDTEPRKPGVLSDFYEHRKLREFCATCGKIFNTENSFSLIKYLRNTTRSWASNEQSLVNFEDGHSALFCCIAILMWNDP